MGLRCPYVCIIVDCCCLDGSSEGKNSAPSADAELLPLLPPRAMQDTCGGAAPYVVPPLQ
jgi:hypothetical protein